MFRWVQQVFFRCLPLVWSLPSLHAAAPPAPPQPQIDSVGYSTTVAPFFKAYCADCHEGPKAKGDFKIDASQLPNNFADVTASGHWREVARVLTRNEMPPKKSKQPSAQETTAVLDWITTQAVKAEQARRSNTVVLRRLNREEYQNTIRDLVGVDFDASGFPQDPLAGGFDNNGSALTMSPLQVELYLSAARQILDRALVEGDRPEPVKWRFTPKVGPADRTRQRLDAKNNPLVNGGNNRQVGKFVAVHRESWDRTIGARDFRVPVAGTYVIRVSAAGTKPDRSAVIRSAEKILGKRRDDQTAKQPTRAEQNQAQFERDLEHFKNDPMYDYGPARIRLTQQLGPQPRTLKEFDATGSIEKPQIHEFRARFTTESAGVHFEYAYSIPKVLENFWMQGNDEFARPEMLVEWFEIEGPLHDAWPPASHTNIFIESPQRAKDERLYATEVLTGFMRRAYRRPVTAEEVAGKIRHFDSARQEGANLVEAIKRPLAAVLISPHFLYLAEQKHANSSTLTPHELASRLSYFIWSSMPDAELLASADSGALASPSERSRQARRMLANPKSEALVRNFTGQWLGLRDVGNNPPASDLYPQYDRHLETSIVTESESFFREILQQDIDVRSLIKSDFVTINERLARFYGINAVHEKESDKVRGDHFRKVKVPARINRGGIITQASILTTTSNGTRTSPVKRGTWILKNLLDMDPGLPVANVGDIAPKVPGIDKATVRKRLEIHRSLEQCARCHNKIDPLGFALENFNAAGEWRDREGFGYRGRIERNDPLIDASSEMIDGTKIVGVAGLQNALLAQEELFLRCLTGKLITYAMGREMGLADQPLIIAAANHMKQNGYTLRSLVEFITMSNQFANR